MKKKFIASLILSFVVSMPAISIAGQTWPLMKKTATQKSSAKQQQAAPKVIPTFRQTIEAKLGNLKNIPPLPKSKSFCNLTVDIGAVFYDWQLATLNLTKETRLSSLSIIYNATKCSSREELVPKFEALFNELFVPVASECGRGNIEACRYLKGSVSLTLISASILNLRPDFVKDTAVLKAMMGIKDAPSTYLFNQFNDTLVELNSEATNLVVNTLQIGGIYDGENCFSPIIALQAPRCAKNAIDNELAAARLAGKDTSILENLQDIAEEDAEKDESESNAPTTPSEANEAEKGGFGGGSGGLGGSGSGGISSGFSGFGGSDGYGETGICGIPAFEGMLSHVMPCTGSGVLGQIMAKLAPPSNVTTLPSGNCLAGDTGDGAGGGAPEEDGESADGNSTSAAPKSPEQQIREEQAEAKAAVAAVEAALKAKGDPLGETLAEGGKDAARIRKTGEAAWTGSKAGGESAPSMGAVIRAMQEMAGPGEKRLNRENGVNSVPETAGLAKIIFNRKKGTPRPDGDCSAAAAQLAELNCIMGGNQRNVPMEGVRGGGDPNPIGDGGITPMGGGQGGIPGCVNTTAISHVCGRDDGCPEHEAGLMKFVYIDRLGGDTPSEMMQLNTTRSLQQVQQIQNQRQLNTGTQQQFERQQSTGQNNNAVPPRPPNQQ